MADTGVSNEDCVKFVCTSEVGCGCDGCDGGGDGAATATAAIDGIGDGGDDGSGGGGADLTLRSVFNSSRMGSK